MLTAAKFYASQGYSVIPTGANKRSILQWKEFQSTVPTIEQLKAQFGHPKAVGLAVICGQVSGNLEVIDVDTKYDLSGTLWDRFKASIHQVYDKLYVVRTKSGGYHLYLKCEVIEGNQKLAMRPATEDELKANPNTKEVVLIETRGEAGYVIAPPTTGYEKVTDFKVPVLTVDEREIILTAARSFNEVIEEVRPEPRAVQNATSFQLTPWDDYNNRCNVIELLERHGWSFVRSQGNRDFVKRPNFPPTDSETSGDYHRDLNLLKVFSSSTPFALGKGYKPFAIFATLEHNGDFSAAARALIDMGYGESGATGKIAQKVLKSLGAGATKQQISDVLINENGLSEKDAIRMIDNIENQHGPEILAFWETKFTKKGIIINIVRHKLLQFLYDNGFHLFFYNSAVAFRLVQQVNGLVSDVTTETVKKFVKDYINTLPDKFDGISPAELLEVVLKGSDIYFGKGLIEFLDKKPLDILRDTPTEAFFTFTNGIVKVTDETITMHSYGEIDKPVWKSQVIPFSIDIEQKFDPHLTEFFAFIQHVANGSNPELENDAYLMSLVGYLLHRYKDPSRPFAVILAEETEDEKKGGGTGKGILVKALSYMANIARVDGKNFKLDKSFAFQRVDLDTKIVAIEDVRKNVDFEGFYSIITEGMTIEKKNKDEYFIPYEDSPKVLFTTNYTIAGNGGHGKRRQKVFEFSNYFSSAYTPVDHFGHKLFDDWDPDEWNRFYNLMFLSVQDYLVHGVRAVENSEKINRKHIRLSYMPEFLEWWDMHIADHKGKWKPFRDMYTQFTVANNFDKKEYSQKRFRSAVENASQLFKLEFQVRRFGIEKIHEYKIGSEDASQEKDSTETSPF